MDIWVVSMDVNLEISYMYSHPPTHVDSTPSIRFNSQFILAWIVWTYFTCILCLQPLWDYTFLHSNSRCEINSNNRVIPNRNKLNLSHYLTTWGFYLWLKLKIVQQYKLHGMTFLFHKCKFSFMHEIFYRIWMFQVKFHFSFQVNWFKTKEQNKKIMIITLTVMLYAYY